jgi:hypothetical protein
LNLTSDSAVQTLIDDQFDKLASNVNIPRWGAQAASGSVTFFTTIPPIRDMYVYEGATVSSIGDLDQGIPSQNYRTSTTKVLTYANREDFYNSTTGRYELTLDVAAENAGIAANTDSYTVKTVVTGADTDFLVENQNPISFGEDRESNSHLSNRIELSFFADTGTEGGYARIAIGVPLVRNVRIEKAGDSLMIRDYDEIRQEHIGGKVDIYVQGKSSKQVSDQIAFSFESIVTKQGEQSGELFSVLSASAFQFKCQNPRVTVHTPIFEVTQIYNATRGEYYDITGYTIIGDGNTVDIDENKSQNIIIGLATRDVIRVDYRFRSSDTFVLAHQPVSEIISVVGQLSGALTTANYDLVRLEDPLATGNSTIAKDSIRIKFANNLPVTDFQIITDEEHVILLGKVEPLNLLGSDPTSIVVTDQNHSITYVANTDYRVTPGTDTTPTTISMLESGAIVTGQVILISYTAIENFTITYTTNALLNTVQDETDKMKHACADVIVKSAVENKVDFVFTVIPRSGVTNLGQLTSRIRTAIANYTSQLGVGVLLTQSDVVHIIRSITDVDYVALPFIRMVKADGSFIVRDNIGQTSFELFNEGYVPSYITASSVLTYKTVDLGGPDTLFRGVFENEEALIMQTDPLDVSSGAGRAYIRGDGKLVVSTKDGQLPDNKSYSAAYYVYGETGSKDINVASLEYLTIGNMNIIYDTPR